MAHAPAIALIDISLPRSAGDPTRVRNNLGIHFAERLKAAHPATGVVLFSAHEDCGREVFNLISTGLRGLAYILKGCSPSVLLNAMREVVAGRVVIDAEVRTVSEMLITEIRTCLTPEENLWVERVLNRLHTLTPREKDVATLLASAYNNDGIAQALNVTPKTAESHISHVYSKLGLSELPVEAPHLRPVVILAKAHLIRDLGAK